jgi:hypothetical protein
VGDHGHGHAVLGQLRHRLQHVAHQLGSSALAG